MLSEIPYRSVFSPPKEKNELHVFENSINIFLSGSRDGQITFSSPSITLSLESPKQLRIQYLKSFVRAHLPTTEVPDAGVNRLGIPWGIISENSDSLKLWKQCHFRKCKWIYYHVFCPAFTLTYPDKIMGLILFNKLHVFRNPDRKSK